MLLAGCTTLPTPPPPEMFPETRPQREREHADAIIWLDRRTAYLGNYQEAIDGDFDHALDAYNECMKVSKNPDGVVSTSHWLYRTCARSTRTSWRRRRAA